MSATLAPVLGGEIIYPESDGEPMADNTKQFAWIGAEGGYQVGGVAYPPGYAGIGQARGSGG